MFINNCTTEIVHQPTISAAVYGAGAGLSPKSHQLCRAIEKACRIKGRVSMSARVCDMKVDVILFV